MKQSIKISFCGIIAALSVAVMFLGGLIPIATIAVPAIAGCLLLPVVATCGARWAFGVYGAVSLISFFLATDREALLIYVLFFGYYPVLYAILDRISKRFLRYLIKIVLFNMAAVSEGLLTVYVLGIPFESISFLGPFTVVVLLALANVVFILYDYALRGLIFMYYNRFHQTIMRLFKRR